MPALTDFVLMRLCIIGSKVGNSNESYFTVSCGAINLYCNGRANFYCLVAGAIPPNEAGRTYSRQRCRDMANGN